MASSTCLARNVAAPRPRLLPRRPALTTNVAVAAVRAATSSSSTVGGAGGSGSPTQPPPPSPPPSAQSPEGRLTWGQYLALRKQRRLAGAITTLPTTLLAGSITGSYLLAQEVDPTQAIAGIDPIYVYAGLTLAATGLGYLVGPTLGSSLWSLYHRRHLADVERMDADFYDHIRRNRVDPSRQTMQNRLPDYYGEKIGSIPDYRKWLRDQAAFRAKAAHGVEDDEKLI